MRQYIRDNRVEFLVLFLIFLIGCIVYFASLPPPQLEINHAC